ncbi:MAG: hypothetical protein JWO08_3635 [Verrucomicrobiaceae bacterium]|nr:hypothetical protein [Verrucomicrobiaceae bacterium]
MARKTTTELSPPPSVASNPSPVAETKPSPPAKADLLKQASAATRTERPEIYRKVLAEDAHNPEALRGLVRASLADMPPNGERLDELKQWANELVALNEPLGTHALGCIAFQQASETDDDLTAVTRRLAEAVVLLKRSLAAKQTESYFFLVQAYINLHNVRVQNKAGPEAERTRRALLNDIANAPPEVPAKDSRSLAVRLEGLLKERASTGKPHPHAAFLRPVIRSLYTKAAEKGDDVSKTWLKSVAKQ